MIFVQVAMRALGFEPKRDEIRKIIAEFDPEATGSFYSILMSCFCAFF